MIRVPRISHGFTLIELLVVIGIISLLMGLLIPVVLIMKRRAQYAASQDAMRVITSALDGSRSDFRQYPPDNTFGSGATVPQDGSRALAYYLATRFKWGESHNGAYIDQSSSRFVGNPPALVSPLQKHMYLYANIYDADGICRSVLVVDPGPDGKFGGTINTHPADKASPWQSDGTGDDADNIFSAIVK